MELASPPYAPKLFAPGSEYVVSTSLSQLICREVLYTQHTQLVGRQWPSRRVIVDGDIKLAIMNFRNYSKALTSLGTPVKAWSFHSGVLPGAEMMYLGTRELDDIFAVTEMEGLSSQLTTRFKSLWNQGLLKQKADHSGYHTDLRSAFYAGIKEVYIIDDWVLFSREIEARRYAGIAPYEAYPDPCQALKSAISLGILCLVGNVPENSELRTLTGNPLKLESFDGYKSGWPLDLELYFNQPVEVKLDDE